MVDRVEEVKEWVMRMKLLGGCNFFKVFKYVLKV